MNLAGYLRGIDQRLVLAEEWAPDVIVRDDLDGARAFVRYAVEAVAAREARGEVIHELLNRPSLSLSQIDWLVELCDAEVERAGPGIRRIKANKMAATLRALRAELTREDVTDA